MNIQSPALTPGNKSAQRIEQLDGWRAIAAFAIAGGHFFVNAHLRFTQRIPGLYDLLNFVGHLGLQALFVISGYIICRLLLIEEQRYGRFSFRGFYIRRFVRVLPPFYFYLAVLATLAYLGLVRVSGQQLTNAAMLVVDFRHFSADWTTLHVWSLSVEEQFYLFFPTALFLTPRRWRRAVFAALCVILAVAANVIDAYGRTSVLRPGVMAGFVGIFCGIVLSLYEDQARAIARRISPKLVVLLAFALLLLTPLCLRGRSQEAFVTLALPVSVGLFLFFTIEQDTWFSRILCWSPLRLIGITSYSLYLWQQLFTGISNNYIGVGRYIPALMPSLLLIVPFSWIVIEKPSMALGKTLSRRWRQPSTATARGPIEFALPGEFPSDVSAPQETGGAIR